MFVFFFNLTNREKFVEKIRETNFKALYINVSSVVEFQRWWVPKSKIFGQESTYSKDELRFIKKCQNRTFKVNFRCQKSTEFFQKKFSSKNINLGDHFLTTLLFDEMTFLAFFNLD